MVDRPRHRRGLARAAGAPFRVLGRTARALGRFVADILEEALSG